MNKYSKIMVFGVLPLVALIAVGLGLYTKFVSNADLVANAKTGDCVRDDTDDADEPYRLIACTDPAAKYKALDVQPASNAHCRDVAGASSSVTTDDNTVCLGLKDVDPAKAINVAKVGDCVDLDTPDPQRVACTAPEADHKILKREENVLSFQTDGTCKSVPGADKTYSWDWQGNGALRQKTDNFSVDVVLCFGPK
jgi:hypothetical protein